MLQKPAYRTTRTGPAIKRIKPGKKTGKGRLHKKPARPIVIPDAAENMGWYALITAPQSEAMAALLLGERGFTAINPVELVEVRGHWRGRHKRMARERALLTSLILFAHLGPVPWLTVLEVSRVTGVIGVDGMPSLIPVAAALDVLRRSGLKAETRRPSIAVDRQARVIEGPFDGFEGMVVAIREGRAKVLLGLSGALGGGVHPVDISEDSLERATG